MTDLDRAAWIERIANAAGERIGTREQREAYAAKAIEIAAAFSRWWQEHHRYAIAMQYRLAVENVTRAMDALDAEVSRNPVGAQRLSLSSRSFEPLRVYLDNSLLTIDGELRSLPTPKPGPNNRGALGIATQLAAEYKAHFGKSPARSKKSAVNAPFTRVCEEVERLLAATGHVQSEGFLQINLSNDVRLKAIKALNGGQ